MLQSGYIARNLVEPDTEQCDLKQTRLVDVIWSVISAFSLIHRFATNIHPPYLNTKLLKEWSLSLHTVTPPLILKWFIIGTEDASTAFF